MRIIPAKASLLLLTLAGCLRTSTDAAVLAPLSQLTPGLSDPGDQPEYVIFGDQLTATVFKNLKRDSRYRIVSTATRLVCPSKGADGIQGYVLWVRVDKLMSDSAVATMKRTCSGSHQSISTGEHLLLVRRSGKWKLDRIIDGFTAVDM
jgi:hypothetical protein